MSATYPMFTWGTVDDLTTWTQSQAGMVTSSIADPFGGTAAYSLSNNTATGSLAVRKNIVYVRDGYQEASFFIKSGSAVTTTCGFRDVTLLSWNYLFNISWTNGAPTGSNFPAGVGGTYKSISVGNGWWYFRAFSTGSVSANSNQFYIYPASTNTVSGSVSVYWQNSVIAGSPIFDAVADEQYSDSTIYAQAPSGVEDSWITTTDDRLRGKLRWIPPRMTDTPSSYSGYYGFNESAGINVGFKEMIADGRAKTTIRFSPDSSNIASYLDSYLFEPLTDGLSIEEDGTRSLTFGIRNTSGSAYEGF